MKFGLRTPSFKKSVSARTTGNFKRKLKRSINPYYGKRGMGWINNPKKAMYNKIYHKTTFGISDIVKPKRKKRSHQNSVKNTNSVWSVIFAIISISLIFAFWQFILAVIIIFGIGYYLLKKL